MSTSTTSRPRGTLHGVAVSARAADGLLQLFNHLSQYEDEQLPLKVIHRRLHLASRRLQALAGSLLVHLPLHMLGRLSRSPPWAVLQAAGSVTSVTLGANQLKDFSTAPQAVKTAAGRQLRRLHIKALRGAADAAVLQAISAALSICSGITCLTLEGEGFLAGGVVTTLASSEAVRPPLQQLQLIGVGDQVDAAALLQLSAAPGLVSVTLSGQAPSGIAVNPVPLQLPTNLAPLHSLTKLCLNYTAMEELPGGVVGITCLLQLDLAHNSNLTTLPASLAPLRRLSLLDISGSKVQQLPEDLGVVLPSLVVLRLEHCRELVALPPSLTCITRLDAAHTGHHQRWRVDHMTALVDLNLGCTIKMPSIWDDSGKEVLPTALELNPLTRLQALHLGGPFFSISSEALPGVVQVRPQLRKLVVDSGCSASRQVDVAMLTRLYDLQHLHHLGFHAALKPAEAKQLGRVGVLTRLQRLELLSSKLEGLGALQQWLASCPVLKDVSLRGNTSLVSAAELAHLPRQLLRLDVTRCKLQGEVPAVLGEFTRLQVLLVREGNKWGKPQLQEVATMLPNLCCSDI